MNWRSLYAVQVCSKYCAQAPNEHRKINSYKSDLVDLFRSLGLAPFVNTPCQRSDEEHSRVFQISLDEV